MNDEDGLRRALLEHYDGAARELPWRGETDPYRVLVSEVMLQQTRVDTVRRYYGPWLERFPDLETLAAAEEDEVLKAWEGLGYYRRARSLRKTALAVKELPDGALPARAEALRGLPGIGEYTAGAVASIAYGEVAPAVDGNARRVLSRLFDRPEPIAGWLRSTAGSLVDRDRPGDWNQALMELGATVCTPRAPGCERCPVEPWCASAAAGTQLDRPGRKPKRPVPTVRFVLGVFHSDGRVLLVKRPAEGLLAGLWAFPEIEVVPEAVDARPADAMELADALRLRPSGRALPLPTQEHRFTHRHAVYLPFSVEVDGAPAAPGRVWIDPSVTDELALPVAQRRVLDTWKPSIDPEAGRT